METEKHILCFFIGIMILAVIMLKCFQNNMVVYKQLFSNESNFGDIVFFGIGLCLIVYALKHFSGVDG